MSLETWKSIPGWEGYYSVSDQGRVRRDCSGLGTSAGRIRTPTALRDGYMQVRLHHAPWGSTAAQVHRLVLAAFVGPCPDGKEVNHIDANRQNNALPNLEYVTRAENVEHMYRLGRRRQDGEHNNSSKLNWRKVKQFRTLAETGVTLTVLAEKFSIGITQASRIRRRESWT